MNIARPVMFWVVTLTVGLAAAVLLREILLPFAAGMLLAYLLDAPVNRLERIGFNRAAAALVIIGVFLVAVIVLIVLTAPFLGAEVAAFIDDFPAYVRRLHDFATDPARPWLRKIVGEGFGVAEQSSGDIARLSAGWLTDFDEIALVSRKGPSVGFLAPGRDADRCVLFDPRLEPHCCHYRRLDSGGASPYRSGACPRDR